MAKTAAELVQEARAQIQNVSPKNALDEIASGKAVLLDVREPAEWEEHIEGSVQVPRGVARVRCRSHESAAQLRAGSEPPRDRVLQVGGTRHARRPHPENNGLRKHRQYRRWVHGLYRSGLPDQQAPRYPWQGGELRRQIVSGWAPTAYREKGADPGI
jgi:rhodanese-related sulfurtransferase